MKNKLLLICAATAMTVGFASSAFADTSETGILNLTGSVPAQCSVVSAGSPPAGATFGATVDLDVSGSIADANGHLLGGLAAGANALGSQTFQVNCTGAANAVSLKATPLATNPVVAAPTGYANTVNYTAEVDFAVTGGVNPVKIIHTSDSSISNAALGSGVRLANSGTNITILAYSFNTTNTATDILVAGAYAGAITVTVGPGT